MKHLKLRIRLHRVGGFKNPSFWIVVINANRRRNCGRFLDRIGFFTPQYGQRTFGINSYRLGFWLNNGAFMNLSVMRLLSKFLSSQPLDGENLGVKTYRRAAVK